MSITVRALLLVTALSFVPCAYAADFVWDNNSGDGDWFGANWTVSGSPGQTAADENDTNGNAQAQPKINDYHSDANAVSVFNGDDTFTLNAGDSVDNFATGTGVAYFHDNTTVTIDQASVRLYANLWLPSKVLDSSTLNATDSTLHFTRGNNSGNAFVIGDSNIGGSTPSVTISGTMMTVDQWDSNNLVDEGGDFELFESGSFEMSNSSTLNISRQLQIDDNSSFTSTDGTITANDVISWDTSTTNFTNTDVTIAGNFGNSGRWQTNSTSVANLDNTTLSATQIDLNESSTINIDGNSQLDINFLRIDNNNAAVNFTSGHIDLENDNPLRGSSGFDGDFDFVGSPGEVTITQNNVTLAASNMAFKLWQGFFSIDGQRISPNGEGFDPSFVGTDIAGLNGFLATQIVNGKFFEITDSTDGLGTITLNLVQATIVDGDFNLDGFVNAADYTIWRDTLGDTGSDLAADANGDLVVDSLDYDFWVDNYGSSPSPSTATASASAVPEPSTLIILLSLSLPFSIRRRN